MSRACSMCSPAKGLTRPAARSEEAYLRWVIYVPFATPESTGLVDGPGARQALADECRDGRGAHHDQPTEVAGVRRSLKLQCGKGPRVWLEWSGVNAPGLDAAAAFAGGEAVCAQGRPEPCPTAAWLTYASLWDSFPASFGSMRRCFARARDSSGSCLLQDAQDSQSRAGRQDPPPDDHDSGYRPRARAFRP